MHPPGAHLLIELRVARAAPDVLAALEAGGAHVESVELGEVDGRRLLVVDVRFPPGERVGGVARLSGLEEVLSARWSA